MLAVSLECSTPWPVRQISDKSDLGWSSPLASAEQHFTPGQQECLQDLKAFKHFSKKQLYTTHQKAQVHLEQRNQRENLEILIKRIKKGNINKHGLPKGQTAAPVQELPGPAWLLASQPETISQPRPLTTTPHLSPPSKHPPTDLPILSKPTGHQQHMPHASSSTEHDQRCPATSYFLGQEQNLSIPQARQAFGKEQEWGEVRVTRMPGDLLHSKITGGSRPQGCFAAPTAAKQLSVLHSPGKTEPKIKRKTDLLVAQEKSMQPLPASGEGSPGKSYIPGPDGEVEQWLALGL
ncbi:hypothetical protein llap_2076 [Limosa lapponica baueri]|uniref:Uncharacterized protein n=1 Tax=Limosa lapponica baueri TaxID=1758121 RepID=A0A2I0UNI8_LIMLA|nr:hypothetical protein llap_2076 [Limosa lapponica baueri]